MGGFNNLQASIPKQILEMKAAIKQQPVISNLSPVMQKVKIAR